MNTHNFDLTNVMWSDPSVSRRYLVKREKELDLSRYGGQENQANVIEVDQRFETVDSNGSVADSSSLLSGNPLTGAPAVLNVKQEPRTEEIYGYSNPQPVTTPPVNCTNVVQTMNCPQMIHNNVQTTSNYRQSATGESAAAPAPLLTHSNAASNSTQQAGSNTTGVNSDSDATTSFHDIFQMAQSDLHRTMPSTSVAPVVPWRTASRSPPMLPPHGSPFNPLQAYYQNALMNMMQPSTSYQQPQFCQGGIFQGQQAFLQSQQYLQPQVNGYQHVQIPQLMNYAPVQQTGKQAQNGGRSRVNNPDKTAFTFDHVIFLTLLSAPTERLMVSEMYPFIQHYFYCFREGESWKSSLRHALGKTSFFMKDGACGNSSYYKINPDKLEHLHLEIHKVVEKNRDNLEKLRLKNITDLTNLINGRAQFPAQTHLVMRNNQRKVTAKKNQVAKRASPYLQNAPETYAQRLRNEVTQGGSNMMHQAESSMNHYGTEQHNQQVNYHRNHQMQLSEASGMFSGLGNEPSPGTAEMNADHLPAQTETFQVTERLENQLQVEAVQFNHHNYGFADSLTPITEIEMQVEDATEDGNDDYNEFADDELFRDLGLVDSSFQ